MTETAKFTLDTSGHVNLGKAGFPFHNEYVEWSDLSPFEQGYVEALFASGVEGYAHQLFLREFAEGRKPWAFSDLAPETLAAILKDCASARAVYRLRNRASAGEAFWVGRQKVFGDVAQRFPPLTPSLGDDGKVYLRAAS